MIPLGLPELTPRDTTLSATSISPNAAQWAETAPWRRYAARFLAFQHGLVIRPSEFVPRDEWWRFEWPRPVSVLGAPPDSQETPAKGREE